MKACILIKVEAGKHDPVAKIVAGISGVKAAFPVLGRTDVVANVEVAGLKELSTLALEIGKTTGVTATETLVALEA